MDELRTALELATEDELQALTDILFRRRFNPLDYLYTPEPFEVQSQSHEDWLDLLEHRFRFLAADGFTVLRRRTEEVSYRDVLVQVCRYLKIPYRTTFSAADLESEVFLHVLEQAWKKLPAGEKQTLSRQVRTSLADSEQFGQLPVPLQQDPMRLLLTGGSALAISSVVRPWLLQQIARQFALHMARYQVAQQTLVRGGVAATAQLQHRVALSLASRGMAVNAARYTAVRGMFAVLGPALWAWFFADLGWRSIATNYARVIPVVFALAQIRLARATYLEAA